MNLIVKSDLESLGGARQLVAVTPESAGWKFVSFAVYRMQAGSGIADATGNNEAAIITGEFIESLPLLHCAFIKPV